MSEVAAPHHDNASKVLGVRIPYDTVQEPGAYVCHWSGHLLRLTADALRVGSSPVLRLSGTGPLFITKISDDPFISTTRARILAANGNLSVNF